MEKKKREEGGKAERTREKEEVRKKKHAYSDYSFSGKKKEKEKKRKENHDYSLYSKPQGNKGDNHIKKWWKVGLVRPREGSLISSKI